MRVNEHVHKALVHALQPHTLRRGDHDAAHPGVDGTSSQYVCSQAHVLDAPVRAGANHRLVYRDVAALGHGMGIAR